MPQCQSRRLPLGTALRSLNSITPLRPPNRELITGILPALGAQGKGQNLRVRVKNLLDLPPRGRLSVATAWAEGRSGWKNGETTQGGIADRECNLLDRLGRICQQYDGCLQSALTHHARE